MNLKRRPLEVNDMVNWYIGCFIIVAVSVGAMWGFGMFDVGIANNGNNMMSAAAVQSAPATPIANSTQNNQTVNNLITG